MSITVNGRSPLSLTCVSAPTTTISARFLRQLFNAASPAWVPITLYTAEHGFFTVVVRPVVGTSIFDLSLGLDWNASMRELLLGSGWILPSRFDPVRFFLPTLASTSSASLDSSTESARTLSSVGNSAGGAVYSSAGGAEERAVGAAVYSSADGAEERAGGAAVYSSAGGAEERAVGAAVYSSAGGAEERAVGAAVYSSAGGADERAVGAATSSSAGGAGTSEFLLEGFDLLQAILSASDLSHSVFLNVGKEFLRRLLECHGIDCALFQTVEQYQLAILNHLMLGLFCYEFPAFLSLRYRRPESVCLCRWV
ncbi:hypothetical protein R3P38DRAFT_2809357 [Favolaschia claudopus]|uniref:Uncharacterized protein n=1 Tax=Favolaschia claudopus TaxID=2862362 RepID=A0AAV9ZDR4_9AGAR